MNDVVVTCELGKRYRRVAAVEGLSVGIPEGSIYGLLGPNGAGKTTTLDMLMNLQKPSSGEAIVLGTDSRRLKGWVQPSRWDGLDARQRREAADNLAKRMVDQDVDDAEISLIPRNELIITIDHGTVVLVQGGRL